MGAPQEPRAQILVDWILVGKAIEIGKAEAMREANVNRPVGGKCNRAIGAWLRKHGLSDVSAPERYKLLLILDNLPAVEAWRAGLTEEKRRRLWYVAPREDGQGRPAFSATGISALCASI